MTTQPHLRGSAAVVLALSLVGTLVPGGARADAPVATAPTPLSALPMSIASSASSGPAVDRSAGSAWEDPSYRPDRGSWRDYVLAPTTRLVRPVAVEQLPGRGGGVEGDPERLLRRDGRSLTMTSQGDRTTSPLVVVDFGKEVSGPVRVHVTGASAQPPDLRVCYSESRRYLARFAGQNDGQTDDAPGCDTANIFNGFPGQEYTYDSDSHSLPIAEAELPATVEDPVLRGGFRYATLFVDGPGSVEIDHVSMRFTAAQGQGELGDYAGHFLSSDHLLNKIWYAGAYTVQVNTDRPDTAKSWPYAQGEADHADDMVPGADPGTDVIFDGGKRDRIIWQGDLAVQNPVAYVSTYDLPAVENSLTSLAGQQLEDGYVPAASLVGPHNQGELRNYGEYVTWFVANMAEHYRWTGDLDYLRRWWPAMLEATGWLADQRDETGLISFEASGSCGHYGYRNCGHETYVNSLFVRNLDQMAELAPDVGSPDLAAGYAEEADELRAAVNEQLWNAETGAYRLSLEIPGAYPQDGNAAAVLAGVASARKSKRALAYLRRTSWNDIGALTVSPSTPNSALPAFHAPLPSWMEVDARLTGPGAGVAQQETSFVLMKRFWGWMLDRDPGSTFWEHVLPDGTPNLEQFSSLAHGWAAGPTVTMSTHVLGVNPLEAGFRKFEVRPHPGSLRWAEGTVPTPRGPVRTSWTTRAGEMSMQVRVPDGTSADLAAPVISPRATVTLGGVRVWRDGQARNGSGASFADGYVTVPSVGPGRHTVATRNPGPVRTRVEVVTSPIDVVAEPGDIQALDAVVTGRAPGRLTGTVAVDTPPGWRPSQRRFPIDVRSGGRTVSRSYRFFVQVPDDASGGSFDVRAEATVGRRADVGVTRVRLSRTNGLFGFDGSADGWRAGENVTSVTSVSGFANGPGRPYSGSGALEAIATAAPGEAERKVLVEPASPLDLGSARSLLVRMNGYGGAPGADGYQGTVRLTGADGDVLEETFAVSPDAWNTLDVDLSAWDGRSAISRAEVSFAATGTTQEWQPRFQVDAIEWVE